MPDRTSDTFSTDRTSAEVNFVFDVRPSTLLEESTHGGHTRLTAPVGTPNSPAAEVQSVGGRNLGDYEVAERLGALGRKGQ